MRVGSGRLAVLELVGLIVLWATPGIAVEPGPRTFYIGSIGRTHDTAASDPRVWLEYELEDWKNPVTGTTLVSDRRCGLSLDIRLLGTHRRNYLELEALADPGQAPVHFDPAKVELIFGKDAVRAPGFARPPEVIDLDSGDRLFAAIPFPDKGDFAGKAEVGIRIPLGSCMAEMRIKRPDGQAEHSESSTIWSRMQVGLELGSGIGKTGSLKDVTSNGIVGGLSVARYPWMNHGFWLGFEFQSLGGPSGFGAVFGYSYRHFLSARWSIHYDVAPGIYELSDASSGLQPQSLNNALFVAQRIGVDWVFVRLGEPVFLESDHSLGLLLSDDWLPGTSLAGNPASGQNFSLQFRYLFGI